jgi:hypothetical protein
LCPKLKGVLPVWRKLFENEVLPGTENADQPAEEMSEQHDHGKNFSGKIRIQLFAKSFILQVYDVLARQEPFIRIPYALEGRRPGYPILIAAKAVYARLH